MYIDYKLIGKRIQKARKDIGITQEKLSERIGVTVGYVSQIERGFTRINLDTLAQIATVLNCDVAHFISGTQLNSETYLNDELYEKIKAMNKSQKALLSHIADGILKYN